MVGINDALPLTWAEMKKNFPYFRQRAYRDFLYIFNKFKSLDNYPFKWGDEVEFTLLRFDHKAKKCQLLLKSRQFFDEFLKSDLYLSNERYKQVEFHQEYTAYMLETISSMPNDAELSSLCKLEEHMRLRREIMGKFVSGDEFAMSLCCFPQLGCARFTHPSHELRPAHSFTQSYFYPQEAIYPNLFFEAATRNINSRRGRRPIVHVPIYVDERTPRPFVEDLAKYGLDEKEIKEFSKPDQIYMDAGGFGMGCCSLQITFQVINKKMFLLSTITATTKNSL
jgi:glutamate--cysteine ligase catalytic subunit